MIWKSTYSFNVNICISFCILVEILYSFTRWHFPLYHHAALQVTCLHILQEYSSARPLLWSLQDQTGFHSIFCLPLCHASLCWVEAQRAAPRSSSTRTQRSELLSAHTSWASAAGSALPGFMQHLSSHSPLFSNASGLLTVFACVRSLFACGGMCW